MDYYKQKSVVESLSFSLLLQLFLYVSHQLSYDLFEGEDHVFLIFLRVPSLLTINIYLLNFLNIGIS